jgi:hypothetical protein
MMFSEGDNAMNLNWNWELRGEGEFQTPEVSSIYEGWNGWEADLASTVSSHSEVFTREITQNFVDASRLMDSKRIGVPKLTFRFMRLTGDEAAKVREKLAVEGISKFYMQLDESQRRTLKLPASELLGGNSKDLSLMVVSERGTSGMLGPWARDSRYLDKDGNVILRRMRDALLSSAGSNAKGSLGSYGEGKRAIIASSAPRSLFTYTAFDENSTEDGVSRRLLGTTYWRPFNDGNLAYSGLALFGEKTTIDSRPEPFTNDAADEIVRSLSLPGFEVRDAKDSMNWGTSQIFLEPVVTAEEVRESIERNWWPLLLDEAVEFEVIDERGESLEVDPGSRRYLEPFLRGWKLLRREIEVVAEIERIEELEIAKVGTAGTLCLLMNMDDDGWSKRDPETNRSIVALIRDGMIISYQKFPRHRNLPEPFVRGVYEVSSVNGNDVTELLRQVEPPLHNYWHVKHEAMDKKALGLAAQIYERITTNVREFRALFVEELVKQSVDLPLFDEMLSVAGGKRSSSTTPPPPPPPPSDWSILDEGASVQEFDEVSRWAKATRTIKLKQGLTPQFIEVRFGWKVEGDNGKLEEEKKLFRKTEFLSKGFVEIEPGHAQGLLSPGKDLSITWYSNPYTELWTLQPFVQVTRVSSEIEAQPVEGSAVKDGN